jgi:hypothetical protein
VAIAGRKAHKFVLKAKGRDCFGGGGIVKSCPRCVITHHGQLGISLTFPPFRHGVQNLSPTRSAHVSSTDRNCMKKMESQ